MYICIYIYIYIFLIFVENEISQKLFPSGRLCVGFRAGQALLDPILVATRNNDRQQNKADGHSFKTIKEQDTKERTKNDQQKG